jgi:hypothetical protein
MPDQNTIVAAMALTVTVLFLFAILYSSAFRK